MTSWHVSLYSPYWLVNKTGLTLQYSVSNEYMYNTCYTLSTMQTQHFWGGADNEMTHPPNQALLLFSHRKV